MSVETKQENIAYGITADYRARARFRVLIGIFCAVFTGVMAAGYYSYLEYKKYYRTHVEHELLAVAKLKTVELTKWRSERLWDAEILYGNAVFSNLVRRYFNNSQDWQAEEQLQEWLSKYPGHFEYDQVRLLDPQGVTRISFPPKRPPLSAAVLKSIPAVISTLRPTIVDFYRHDHDKRIYISMLIPILNRSIDKRLIGLVALRIDPEKYIYPFILNWPTPSDTAETLLVRRDGNDVLYLLNLKFQKDAALNFRRPLTRTDIPPALAVLGRTGFVEGVDYRDDPVIAYIEPVPNSPWFLVTRMNTSEVYEPAKKHLWLISGLTIAILLAGGAGLALIWRQQSIVFFRERYQSTEALHKREIQLSESQKAARIGSWNWDVVQNTLEWSDEAYKRFDKDPSIFRPTVEYFVGLIHPDDREATSKAIEESLEHDAHYHVQARIKNESGREWVMEAFGLVRRNKEGKPLLFSGTAQDITERICAEEQIKRSLNEKEVLLKEIHHRVKNNMQVIQSLLNLQSKGIADRSVQAMFEESRDRISSMSLIHENLYQSTDIARVDFKKYLENLIQNIAGTYKRYDVNLLVEMEPLALDVNIGIPCGLIVNELVSNSFKYAFPDGKSGTIKVGITQNREGDNVLTVSDNGIGFPEYLDLCNTDTLGMQLVVILTKQINGTIELERKEGTRFTIVFPGWKPSEVQHAC